MEKKEETAAFPADGDAPKVASPRRKKNRVLNLLNEMWPAYLIEVVVIIVGISITLVLEEWRDNSGRWRTTPSSATLWQYGSAPKRNC